MKKNIKNILCIMLVLLMNVVAACSGGGGGGSNSNQSGGIDTTSPSVPQSLVAVAASSSQINLTWNASMDNVGVTGYRIYRAGTLIATISNTAYNDTGVSPNTAYAYTVCAYDAANNISAQSNVASATTPVLPPPPDTQEPTTPSGLMATPVSSSQINLTWNTSTDNVGVTGYNVYRGGTRLTSVTAPAFNNTGLSASTQYCYTVSAYDGTGNESAQSTFVCATTPALPDTQSPTVPIGLAATAVSPSQINLTWDASTDNVGVTGYNVYRGGALLTSVTDPALNNAGLSASTQYCYTVSAYDGAGNNSSQSSSVCATTPALPDTQAPTVPTGLAANAVGPSQINLTWNASTDNVSVAGYKIYRDNAYLMTVTGTSAQNTGLSPNTEYCYTISAIDAADNESAQTTEQCATTTSPDTESPTVPTGLSANAVAFDQINLSWTASTDNVGVVGYKIYRDGAYLMTVTSTSAQNTGLLPSTEYCYAISAIDAVNNESAQTAQQCATTTSTYTTLSGQWWVIMHTSSNDLYVDATITQFGTPPTFQMQGNGHNYPNLSDKSLYYPVSVDSTNSTFNDDATKAVIFMAYTDARSAGCGIYVVNAAGTVIDYSNISGGAWSEADGTSCANSGSSWTAKRVPDMSGIWWAYLTFGTTTYSYDIRINQIGATMTVSSLVDHGTSNSVSYTTGSGLHDPDSVTGEATLEIAGLPCPDNNAVLGTLNITGNINTAATAYTVTSAEFQGCPAGTQTGSGTMTKQ